MLEPYQSTLCVALLQRTVDLSAQVQCGTSYKVYAIAMTGAGQSVEVAFGSNPVTSAPCPSPPPPPPACTPYLGACFPGRRRSLLGPPPLECCASLGCAVQLPNGISSICANPPGAPSILSVNTTGGAFDVTCVPPNNTGGTNVGERGARWICVACVAVCKPLIRDLDCGFFPSSAQPSLSGKFQLCPL